MMIIRPKYNCGDWVQFRRNGQTVVGTIYDVNQNQSRTVNSYYILSGYMIYRNIRESLIFPAAAV